jgi:hypothetical protein
MQIRGGWVGRASLMALSVAGLGLLTSCGLDAVDIPGLRGPSEITPALRMVAEPDSVASDGHSSAWVTVHVRDRDGQPMPNVTIAFALGGDGGELRPSRTGITDANGVVGVTFVAPAIGGFGESQVFARPIGVDFGEGLVYRFVTIELRPPEF